MNPSIAKLQPGDAVTLRSMFADEDILLFGDAMAPTFVTGCDVLVYLGVRWTSEFGCEYEFVFLCPTGQVACLPTGVTTISARRLV